ncbi:sugar-binding transcriptional regulator [Nonomuraea sp. KC401]|uniref:Sugar-binding transcriptional regulator n=2 Tax=Nonomuraea TaxID=83681 RepID=A0A4R4NHI9_9ACTN|nr:sugar-binding transcriptional regulator [Nonomuraea sp. K271]NBE94458.1 sugar-binding transcriptional regulator [Nonomuraea sp. K271]TDC08505.1 sugar-binding transcriptional regulator [Nonomuraea longispora]TLF72824.1 sugar-binding transcriptional regulator [Nonomuraea sp. KC401]
MRLLVRVARLYHEHGVRQPQIAAQLRISQPRVSRLLKEAAEIGIVRTVVVVPSGVHALLEEDLERKYGVEQIIVVDAAGDNNHDVVAALGSAGATHLDATLIGGEHLGISSWSASLLATVEAMQRRPVRVAEEVVQLIGGVGKGSAQVQATRLAAHLADLTGAEPVFLPAPGLVGTPEARQALSEDHVVRQVVDAWSRLTTVLVGIGSLDPSPLLRDSGNAIDEEELETLRGLGAVGDVCLRFFDAEGRLVDSPLERRILGIPAADLLRVPRRIAIAGGRRKTAAIRAALRGGWVNTLITDVGVAEQLLKD